MKHPKPVRSMKHSLVHAMRVNGWKRRNTGRTIKALTRLGLTRMEDTKSWG